MEKRRGDWSVRLAVSMRNEGILTIANLPGKLLFEPISQGPESNILSGELLFFCFVFILVAKLETLFRHVLHSHAPDCQLARPCRRHDSHKHVEVAHHRFIRRQIQQQHLVPSRFELFDERRTSERRSLFTNASDVVDLLLAFFAILNVLVISSVLSGIRGRHTSSSEVKSLRVLSNRNSLAILT